MDDLLKELRDKSAVGLLLRRSYIASQYLTLHTFVQQLFCYLQLLKRNARPTGRPTVVIAIQVPASSDPIYSSKYDEENHAAQI